MIVAITLAFSALSLAQAQDDAVACAAGVQEARAAVVERAADLHIAQVTAAPHALFDYSLSPQAGSGTQSESSVEQHLMEIGAGISLNDLLAHSDAVREAANQLLSAQRNADAAALSTRVDAVKLYYGALEAIALERFRHAELSAAQRDRTAAELRARTGESPRLDVMRASVALEQARADLAQSSAQRADAVGALSSATGVAASALASVVAQAPQAQTAPGNADALVARALATRPEIAALLAGIDARRAALGAARLSGLPTITADAGYEGGVDTGQEVRGPTVTVHAQAPLASQSGAQTQIALAQLDAARWQLVGERRTIALEVASAVRDARAASDALVAANAALAEASRAMSAVEIGYREGASSSLDVADARRTYVQASVDALVALYTRDEDLAIVELLAQ